VAEDKPTLLIVEDDPGLQKQLKWCFDGYEVITAGDRTAAIAAVRRHEPAVVLRTWVCPPTQRASQRAWRPCSRR
jgi:two-component system NtrC family response regulator